MISAGDLGLAPTTAQRLDERHTGGQPAADNTERRTPIARPTAQHRFGQLTRGARLEPSTPPLADGVSEGKKAACVTPIFAFAAATRRSAAAMSGRRSRSSEGSPAGTLGNFASSA